MSKTATATAATSFFPPVLQLFLGLFVLYIINEILSKFLGLGEKKK